MTAEEVRAIAQPLITASLEMDEILYGKGLAAEGKAEGNYTEVTDTRFTSVSAMKRHLEDIYTAEYCEIIENSMLSGSTDEYGVSYARYIDIDGVMYVHNNAKVYLTSMRRYDFDSIKVKSSSEKRIIFTIDTYTADEAGNYSDTASKIEIKLLYDTAYEGWRLDTPTY